MNRVLLPKCTFSGRKTLKCRQLAPYEQNPGAASVCYAIHLFDSLSRGRKPRLPRPDMKTPCVNENHGKLLQDVAGRVRHGNIDCFILGIQCYDLSQIDSTLHFLMLASPNSGPSSPDVLFFFGTGMFSGFATDEVMHNKLLSCNFLSMHWRFPEITAVPIGSTLGSWSEDYQKKSYLNQSLFGESGKVTLCQFRLYSNASCCQIEQVDFPFCLIRRDLHGVSYFGPSHIVADFKLNLDLREFILVLAPPIRLSVADVSRARTAPALRSEGESKVDKKTVIGRAARRCKRVTAAELDVLGVAEGPSSWRQFILNSQIAVLVTSTVAVFNRYDSTTSSVRVGEFQIAYKSGAGWKCGCNSQSKCFHTQAADFISQRDGPLFDRSAAIMVVEEGALWLVEDIGVRWQPVYRRSDDTVSLVCVISFTVCAVLVRIRLLPTTQPHIFVPARCSRRRSDRHSASAT